MPKQQIYGRIISGFPGVGKSFLTKTITSVIDSDSSKFDKKDFPNNYVKNIKKHNKNGKIVLVSSHKEVRDILIKEGLLERIYYPKIELKEEYLLRYKERGSPVEFINFMRKNWESFINCLDLQKGCRKTILNSQQFIQI